MKSSIYTVKFQLPYKDRALLMHGYTGALDIVSSPLAALLTESYGGNPSDKLQRDARESLRDRGHLTDQNDSQEREHVSKILSVFVKRQQPSITFGLQLKGSSEALQQGFLSKLDNVFGALNDLRAHHVGGALAVDLSRVEDSLEFLDDIIERANEWSYALVLTVATRQAKMLSSYLDSGRIQYLRLISATPEFTSEIPEFLEFAENFIGKGLRGDWLFSIDGRSPSEVQKAYEVAVQIKDSISGESGSINSIFISEATPGVPLEILKDADAPFHAISSRDISVYHHLARFIEMPGLVNLKPYFALADSSYILNSSFEVLTLGEERAGSDVDALSLSRGEEGPDNLVCVGRLENGKITFDDPSYEPNLTPAADAIQRSATCDACPFALICGVHCGRHGLDGSQPDGSGSCGEVFRTRVERVLPALLFNKIRVS